jgi:CMP-N-acetylneuraminic acid synthetase
MTSVFNNLALMPARGGSKSIPKKNIALLAGQPLLSYGLNELKKSRFVRRIIVDTDDPEIAAVARGHGAETPYLRPASLAQDNTSTIAVVEHALEWLRSNEQYVPEYIVLVQPTDPFVRVDQIDDLFQLVSDKKADSGITMVEVPRNCHPYHVRRIADDGYLEFDQPEQHYRHPNRQSDPKRYAFGNVYWFRADAFMREKKIEPGKRVGLLIDGLSAHDINNPLDLTLAEALLTLARADSVR